MSLLRIDKGVPIPNRYPFDEMEVGDSFAVPPNIKRTAVSVAAMRYGRQHDMKFTVRKVDSSGKKFRCWRIK